MIATTDQTSALLDVLSTATGSLLGSRRWEVVAPLIAAQLGEALGAAGIAICAVTAFKGHPAAHGSRIIWPTETRQVALEQLLADCHSREDLRAQLSTGATIQLATAAGGALIAPICLDQRLWGGLVCITAPDAPPWPPGHIDAFVAIARMFAATIGAQRDATARAAAEQLTRQLFEVEWVRGAQHEPSIQLHTLLSMTNALLHTTDPASLLRLAIGQLSDTLGLERVALFLTEGPALLIAYLGGHDRQVVALHGVYVLRAQFDAVYQTVTYQDQRMTIVTGPHFSWQADTMVICGTGVSVITPIRANGKDLGLVINDNALSNEPIDLGKQQLLASYCTLLGGLLERAQTNEQFQLSERRYRMLVETTPDGFALLDPYGRITLCNRSLAQILGYPNAEQLLESAIDLLVVEQYPGESVRFLRTPEPDGTTRVTETELRRYDGERLRAELSIRTLRFPSGQIEGFLVIVHDLTRRSRERDKLQAAFHQLRSLNSDLLRSRNLLRTLFDALDDGLLLLDSDGWVLASNQALGRLVGQPVETTISVEWATICQAIDPTFDGTWVLQTLSDGQPRARRQRIVPQHGPPKMLDIQTHPLAGVNQVAEQLIVRLTDVTERVRLEAQLIEQERFASSGRLAATVAHEINTPLQSIQAALYLIGGESQEQRASYLELAQRELERIAGIVRQLLDAYRPAAAEPTLVDLNRLIDQVLMLIDHRLAETRVTVRREQDPAIGQIHGRQDQITQLLLNLLVNAIQAMPAGGSLVIRTSVQPGAIVLAVVDSGVGIPLERQRQIFEPFFSTKPDGTGLGLAVAAQVVESHGGTISVQSTPDKGSKFQVTFPRAGHRRSAR